MDAETPRPDEVEFLTRLYQRFNARDVDSVLAQVHHDVTWANGMEGGHVYGREELRRYWSRQWTMVDPHVEPMAFSIGAGGEILVRVHQVVRRLDGSLLSDKTVGHVFRIEDGLVRRFDIRAE